MQIKQKFIILLSLRETESIYLYCVNGSLDLASKLGYFYFFLCSPMLYCSILLIFTFSFYNNIHPCHEALVRSAIIIFIDNIIVPLLIMSFTLHDTMFPSRIHRHLKSSMCFDDLFKKVKTQDSLDKNANATYNSIIYF